MKSTATVICAFLFSLLVPFVGYLSFGIWPALLFLTGYLGGFILWLFLPTRAPFKSIKWTYIATFVLFLIHRVEEKVSGFFATLSKMTEVPIPEIISVPIIILLLLSVMAWIIGPILYNRNIGFGYYLVWTFFASMGITELAHFILPLFRDEPYGYFPGMLSVVVLAPIAWWGMWKLKRR